MAKIHRRSFASFGDCMLAVGLVVVMVMAELIALGHPWTERHVVCPEHGELVHADGLAGAATTAPMGVRAVPPVDPARDPAHGGHEHCIGLSCGRSYVALTPGPDLEGPAALGSLRLDTSPRDEQCDRVAILRRAPKTSPPV